jgi:2-keto-4-pentenoate hydratase/2-oxohepta-3-ene-1,7-dioic acid hydratase in catechol pathway
MRLVSYEWQGEHSFGVMAGDRIADLGGHPAAAAQQAPGTQPRARQTLREFLRTAVGDEIDGSHEGPGPLVADVRFDPVIPDPAKVICVGVNYRSHRDEAQRTEIGYPTIFFRFADTQIGHDRPVQIPARTKCFDYEGELAVVIGKPCRDVAEGDALQVVAGYACYNDLSARDWQRHASQWGPGKNFPGTGAFGPYLVTSDEVPDPASLDLVTRVNGEQRQSASTGDMLFSVPSLIAYVTAFTPLDAGDVLVTGTPGGVGLFMDPPTFLSPGDVVEVGISGIGTLRNRIV